MKAIITINRGSVKFGLLYAASDALLVEQQEQWRVSDKEVISCWKHCWYVVYFNHDIISLAHISHELSCCLSKKSSVLRGAACAKDCSDAFVLLPSTSSHTAQPHQTTQLPLHPRHHHATTHRQHCYSSSFSLNSSPLPNTLHTHTSLILIQL